MILCASMAKVGNDWAHISSLDRWSKEEANGAKALTLIGSCHGFTGIGACISVELVKQWVSWIYHAYAKIQGLHLQIKHQVVESFLWYAVMKPHCEGESRERHKSVIQLCKNRPLHQAAVASPAGGNCLIYLHFHFTTNCTKTLVCNMPTENQFSKSNEIPNLR